MPATPPTAVVITTFDVETLAVTDHLDQPAGARRYRDRGGTVYEIGTFSGEHGRWTVAVAEIGPGNSTAGVELERANAAFDPRVMLLVGVAGGLRDLGLGDVVAADAVYDYESGRDTDAGFRPRIKTQASAHRLVQHARLVAREAAWPNRIRAAHPPVPVPQAVVKPVAAGSRVVAGSRSEAARRLREYCGDAVAVEMEGHGFLQGAYRNPGCEALVVRGVSDLLDDKNPANDVRWQAVAARHAAAFAFTVLDNLQRIERRPEPPESTSYDVFVSHADKDAAVAERLIADLRDRHGLRVFAGSTLTPGAVRAIAIGDGMLSAANGVLIFSAAAVADPAVMDEYAALLELVHGSPGGTRLFVPVRIDDVALPVFARSREPVDLRGLRGLRGPDYDRQLDRLAAALRGPAHR